jgi:putative hydrolase of the HAD superfamily
VTLPIRTFLFDLGNVLVRFSHEKMYRQLGELCGRDPAEVLTFAQSGGLLHGYETGTVDNPTFHQAFEAWLGRPIDLGDLLHASSDIFELNEPMDEVLEAAERQGYRLVLLSNTCPSHYERVTNQWGFLDRFHHQVLSYQVGALKPSPTIYQAALSAIECDPSECLYTDDIPEYVDAGRSHGLRGVVFRDPDQFKQALAEHGVTI